MRVTLEITRETADRIFDVTGRRTEASLVLFALGAIESQLEFLQKKPPGDSTPGDLAIIAKQLQVLLEGQRVLAVLVDASTRTVVDVLRE